MSKFTDCVWHKNGLRATQRARLLAFKAAEPMFIVRDDDAKMYGIGTGSSRPHWCKPEHGFTFIKVVHPVVN